MHYDAGRMIDGDDRIAAAAAATADAKRVDDDALHSAARWRPLYRMR